MNSINAADDSREAAMYDRGFCHVAHCTASMMTWVQAQAKCKATIPSAFVYNVIFLDESRKQKCVQTPVFSHLTMPTSEKWREWVKIVRNVTTYVAGNLWWVGGQNPDASNSVDKWAMTDGVTKLVAQYSKSEHPFSLLPFYITSLNVTVTFEQEIGKISVNMILQLAGGCWCARHDALVPVGRQRRRVGWRLSPERHRQLLGYVLFVILRESAGQRCHAMVRCGGHVVLMSIWLVNFEVKV